MCFSKTLFTKTVVQGWPKGAVASQCMLKDIVSVRKV